MKTELTRGSITVVCDTEGGSLRSLKKNGTEYLWQGDPAYWSGQAPILFPIVGSLPGGTANSAEGPCRMERHGLARRMEHRLKNSTASSVTYELTETEDSLTAYPYKFKLNMTYAISGEDSVMTCFTVTNTGIVPLPFAVGGHPAFNVPVPGSEDDTFEDYDVRFTKPLTRTMPLLSRDGIFDMETQRRILDHDRTLAMTHELFSEDALMIREVPDNTATLISRKTGKGVRIDFDGFDFLGIWSAPGNAPFVALEPWISHSSQSNDDGWLEHKEGMVSLEAGKTASWMFAITPLD